MPDVTSPFLTLVVVLGRMSRQGKTIKPNKSRPVLLSRSTKTTNLIIVTYSMIRPRGRSRGGMVGKPDSRINGKILFVKYEINWKFLLLSLLVSVCMSVFSFPLFEKEMN